MTSAPPSRTLRIVWSRLGAALNVSERARLVVAAFAAVGMGIVLIGVAGYVSPLALIGERADVRSAQAAFLAELARYRQAPLDFSATPILRHGVPALEDRAFDTRGAWSVPLSGTGIARAVFKNVARGTKQGASTIDQQLAKSFLRQGPPGIAEKLLEAGFAHWAARQATRDEILGLYLNRTGAVFTGSPAAGTQGIERLALALFGVPLARLGREDQLLLASAPRGLPWLRQNPTMTTNRLLAARRWLGDQGFWDDTTPSWLDEPGTIDPATIFSFVDSWEELLASGPGALDLDLARTFDVARATLATDILPSYPGLLVRAALTIIGPEGVVLARSGSEASLMRMNYGSIAKLAPLALAMDALGPDAVLSFKLAPVRCVRWYWPERGTHAGNAGQWCPDDVQPATEELSLDGAVARSINSMTAAHMIALPTRLWHDNPAVFRDVMARVTPAERERLDSPGDRALAAAQLAHLRLDFTADNVPAELAYTSSQLALYRVLNERRAALGLPVRGLPPDPTAVIGNSSAASIEQIGKYVHRTLFAEGLGCQLSDTGAALALERRNGTLRWFAQRWPKLIFSGKTATSSVDDSALSTLAICLDGRPIVVAIGLRPIGGKLPKGFHGALTLRATDTYLKQLAKLERRVTSVTLPPWADLRANPNVVVNEALRPPDAGAP